MELNTLIIERFHTTMEVNAATIEQYAPLISHTAELMFHTLVNDGKILCCGNGAAATLSQHLTTLLMNRFCRERPGLPAINLTNDTSLLTGISSDTSFSDCYAKMIRALGSPGDILLVISTQGRGTSLIQAIQAAHDRDMQVISLNGNDGGDIRSLLGPDEIDITIPSEDSPAIYHAQMMIIQILCDLIDFQLFGVE